jgi:hypothetical protein
MSVDTVPPKRLLRKQIIKNSRLCFRDMVFPGRGKVVVSGDSSVFTFTMRYFGFSI